MIPNVVKGADMRGLLQYLAGPGRANEHISPHVIGGDGFVQAWHGAEELDRQAATDIAKYLDEPRQLYGTEMRTKQWTQNAETGAREAVLGPDGRQVYRDVNVWHCSLSLPPTEGPLSSERWEAIASDFMDEMGFTAASGKAPARWVAIHHGASKGGNDHIHIAASMVRQDGTRWEGRLRDYPRSQAVCRELERKYGLTPVDGRQFGTAEKGAQPVELRRAEKSGQGATDRQELALRIRAAAVASSTEAEWLRRVRASDVVIRPRFAAGSTDVVVGYRAAVKPPTRDERLNFYGGGQLGTDLSLPRVRENWPAPTIGDADAASAEWQAAFKNNRTKVDKPREKRRMDPARAQANLQAFTEKLNGTPMSDRRAWVDAARDLSGALSAWSRFDPANSEQLRHAAAVVARSAQERRAGGLPSRRVAESPMGTAFLFLGAKADDKLTITASVLINQLIQTATALRDYHQQTGALRQAQAIDVGVVDQLRGLQLRGYRPDVENMSETDRHAWQAFETSRAMAPTGKALTSPLPDELAPRPQTGARANPRGREDHGR